MDRKAAEAIAKEEAKFLAEAAQQILFVKGDERLRPVIFVEYATGQGEMYDLALVPNKNAWAQLHVVLAARPGCKCAALVTEAWSLEGKAKGKKARELIERVDRGEASLGDVPGSIDVVMVNLIVGEYQWIASYRIDRERRELAEHRFECTADGKWEGRMVRGPNKRKGH